MSLTSILKKQQGRIYLKNWFRFHFPNPRLNIKKEIIVNPNPSLGSYAGEIGTAFDYLFRFNIEKINKININKTRNWIAESGYNFLIKIIDSKNDENIIIGYKRNKLVNRQLFKKQIKNDFKLALKNYNKFIKDGILTKELIKSSIILAKLDLINRIGRIDANFDLIETEKIIELEKLFNSVPWNNFKSNENILLNPSFNEGSILVGGADADIIIGDTLIDIKTNREFKLEREDLNQVIGYCLLSIIGKLDFQIKNIGIYFARYGYLWQIPLDNFCDLNNLSLLADEFKQLITDKNLNLINEGFYTKSSISQKSDYIIHKNDFKCPHCDSKNYTKNGTRSKKFRYKCKDCKIGFTSTIEMNSTKKNKNIILFDIKKAEKQLAEEHRLGIFNDSEYQEQKKRLIKLHKQLNN